MLIDIELNDLIDLIKDEHDAEETAKLIQKYVDLDDIEKDEYISDVNEKIVASAVLANNDIDYIISNVDNIDIVIPCAFKFLENSEASDIDSDNLCTLLDMLIEEGYITNTGLVEMDDFGDGPKIEHFHSLTDSHINNFIWHVDDFAGYNKYIDVLTELVKAYVTSFDNCRFCHVDGAKGSYTNAPHKYIKANYFSGRDGAWEVANVLFDNFYKLKDDYVDSFANIIYITPETTLETFRAACYNADYNEFSKAYHDLVDNTDFFTNTGIFNNYFGN